MISPESDPRGSIVRVLVYGKEAEVIDRAILDGIESGHRVLVKVSANSDTPADRSAGAAAVAGWAEALARAHGLAWERVGGDVLFVRASPHAAPEAS